MAEFMQGFVNALTGAMEHHRKIQSDQSDKEEAQQREAFKTLLQFSPDPEMKAAAMTGLMNPPKKNMWGNLKTSPEYEHSLTIIGHMTGMDQGGQGTPPGAQASPPPSGAPPAPSTPQAASMPDAKPLTGGGGLTGPPPPVATPPTGPPGAPPMGAASPPPGAAPPTPGAGISPPPIAPPSSTPAPTTPGGHPVDQQVQSGVFGGSYEEAIKKSLAADKGKIYENPVITQRHEEYRAMLQELKDQGMPFEQGMRMVNDQLFPKWAQQQAMMNLMYRRQTGVADLEALKQKNRLELQKAKQYVTLNPDEAKAFGLDVPADATEIQLDKTLLTQLSKQQGIKTQQAGASARAAARPPAMDKIKTVDDDGNTVWRFVPKVIGSEYTAAPSGAEEGVGKQADRILMGRDQLLASLKDPNVQKGLGPAMGRITSLEQLIGDPDPTVQKFAASLSSWLAMQPKLHGFKGQAALKEFERISGGNVKTPEALAASIQGLSMAAETVQATKPKAKGAPPSPASAGIRTKVMQFDAQGNQIQ
jgi:hypothetical protein